MAAHSSDKHTDNHPLKAAAKLTPILLLLLLAASVLFYKERMLFIDAPHMLFRIINDGALQITEYRYGSFITQGVPLVAAKLHLPLKVVTILYSASFYLFFLAVALLLVYRFRNYALAVLLGLYYTLFVSDTFFWPNNEVHQGIAWLMLALAAVYYLVRKHKAFVVVLAVFVPAFFLAIWTHPLVIPVAAYIWLFWLADGRLSRLSKLQQGILTTILLALSIVKLYQGMHHGYDSTKIEVVTGFSFSKFTTIFAAPQLKFFLHSCVTNYWLFVLLAVVGMVSLLLKRRYILLLLTVGFSLAYLLLIFITYRDLSGNRFYIESEYMPVSIICAAPFVYYVLPRLSPRLAVGSLSFIFCIRLAYIALSSQPFTERVAVLERIYHNVRGAGVNKAIVPQSKTLDDLLIMSWGAPVESILFSALNGDTPNKTFIFATEQETPGYLSTGVDTMLGCWEKRAARNLNKAYFSIDTTRNYTVVTYE
ncbi:MAG: hypothetical protein V4649_13160 [Bacteroidota bacterium]